MASIPFVTDAIAVLDKLESVITKLVRRRDISHDNVETLQRLDQLYKDAIEELQRLSASPSKNPVLTKRLGYFETLLQQNVEKLEAWETKVEEATMWSRVTRMKQILDKCEADANDFFQFLIDHVSPAVKEDENVQSGTYLPDYSVPRNPPRLTLDYFNPDTCEGKLKASVLDHSIKGVIAVAASGKGGVGKTCALRGLAADPDVKQRFPGGTLYIQLGHVSNISTVIKEIARIVRRTGNPSLAKRFEKVRHLQDASDEASVWFRPHTCLLLVDDIWWENGIDIEVLNVLCTMLNDDSRVVFSSRDRRFLSGTDSEIVFSETEARSELARRMLMTHGGYDGKDVLDEVNKVAFEAVLDICQGLPLALGIAGASVLNNLRMKCTEERQNAWSDFYEDIMSKRKDLFELLDVSSGKDKLPKIVDISLEVLEKRKDGRSYQQLFRALSVVKKQQTVPVHMLQRLWDVEDSGEAEQVVESFSTVSIVQARKEDGVVWIQLHDLILDIATRRASQEYETQQFFRTLVHNYVRKDERESGDEQAATTGIGKSRTAILKSFCCLATGNRDIVESETPRVSPVPCSVFQEWWDSDDDGYLYDNLCRGLTLAGYTDELMWLLSKPQWIVKRLQTSGIYGVQQDIEHGTSAVRGKGTEESNIVKHLEMVGKAARMSCTFVKDNPYEAWFQLYGRLVWYAKQCNHTQRFIDEIERCAPRPWARASEGFLQPATREGIDLIDCPGPVLCVSEDNGNVVFVWQGGNKAGCVTQYNPKTGIRSTRELRMEEMNNGYAVCAAFSLDMERVVTGFRNGRIVIWSMQEGSMTRVLEGHTDRVCSVAFNADRSRVVSGSDDRTVRLWDVLSGEMVGQPLVGHSDCVRCVAFSADGSRLVSGSYDHTIRLWDALSREAMGQPFVGHDDYVRYVAFSVDGSRVVSGSEDGNVRLWDALSGEAVGQPLVGHTDYVRCVAFNADGSRVVSGSGDGTVRLWDALSGEAVGQPLLGHKHAVYFVAFSADGGRVVSGADDFTIRLWDTPNRRSGGQPLLPQKDCVYVRCVAYNADGSRLVSGSGDGTVRLWNTLNGEAVGSPLVGHTRPVCFVAFSADGSLVVSGSVDCTVRIWDALSGKAVTRPLMGHTVSVKSVAFSADRSRVVSGSDDGLVRIWDALNGEAVGEPLIGHTDTVHCVAFSADGSRVVSGSSDGTVRLWDGLSGEAVGQPLVGHMGHVWCVAFSADANRVVSGSIDGTVRLWDALSARAVGDALLHDGPVTRIGVDAQCSRVVSLEYYSGVGRLWDVHRGVCVLTSHSAAWESTFNPLEFTWSPELEIRQITERRDDGTDIVATCDGSVIRFGHRWCTRASGFSEFCEILR